MNQTPSNRRTAASAVPLRLELRIPISPFDKDLRMLRYLLESLQEFGGPIGRAAHCVVSVSADEPPRDLVGENPWTEHHSVEFRWLDDELFQRREYDATGYHRLWIESDADVVALLDVDLLIAGDFDAAVLAAHREQTMLGFIAHVSPFAFPELADTPSERWWNLIFEEAGLEPPDLRWQYTGWEIDWQSLGFPLVSKDPRHRYGPPYFNYGFVVAPRRYFERMGETFEAELDAVDRVVESGWYKSQIANCLAFARHGIPCKTLPLNYNFPLNLPADAIRALNPDPGGEDGDEDVKVFHYIEGRDHFATRESVEELLGRSDLGGAWPVFLRKLRVVHDRIAARGAGRAAGATRKEIPALRAELKRLQARERRLVTKTESLRARVSQLHVELGRLRAGERQAAKLRQEAENLRAREREVQELEQQLAFYREKERKIPAYLRQIEALRRQVKILREG